MVKFNIKNIWIKERKSIIFSVIMGFIIAIVFSIYTTYEYSENIQNSISDSVVRLHVLANSNNPKDIELKYKVRNSLLDYTKNFVNTSKTKYDFIDKINNNIDNIKQNVINTLHENGSNYDVKVYFDNNIFPYKKYGNISFPAGDYLGLRVEIGEAKGDNWWCVMFPSMCFTDETCTDIDEKGYNNIKNVIGDEEYSIISHSSNNNVIPKMKFKIVEIWQNIKYKNYDFVTNSDK